MHGAADNDDFELYLGGVDAHAQEPRQLDAASVDAAWVGQYLEWSEGEIPVVRLPAAVLGAPQQVFGDPSWALATFGIEGAYLPPTIAERLPYVTPHA